MVNYPRISRSVPLIAAVCLVAGLAGGIVLAEGAHEVAPFTVMSFNIRYDNPGDGDNRWELRKEAVAQQIRDLDPDVLCLQEALRHQLDDLHELVPGYAEYGVGRDDGVEAGEYSAILVKRDWLPVMDSGTFWLSDTPDVPGSTSYGNSITRIATWVQIDIGSGRDLGVFNTHLDHQSQESRVNGVLLIRREMWEKDFTRNVVTGDFNAGEDNPAIELMGQDYPHRPVPRPEPPLTDFRAHPILAGFPYVDTFRMLHPNADSVGTYNGWTGDRSGDKIDYVFTSAGCDILDAGILNEMVNGRYTSDHFPVYATIKMRLPDRL